MKPVTTPSAPTVTLVTGDRVTVTTIEGHTRYELTQAAGTGPAEMYRNAAGDQFVVPAVAKPYLGRGLDPSLFDVSALLRDGLTAGARIPLSLTYAAGATPSAPPGVTLTSNTGRTAHGYLTTGSATAFTSALRAAIGADVKAGRAPGTGPLPAGLTGLSLAAAAATPAAVTPHYALGILQVNVTDPNGNPLALGDVIVSDMDDVGKASVVAPVVDGVARVAVPAGHYLATSIDTDLDANGFPVDSYWASSAGVTVSAGAAAATATIDLARATSRIAVSTPRPATQQLLYAGLYLTDGTGTVFSDSLIVGGDIPTYVAPMAGSAIGAPRFLITWDGAGPTTGPAYRYDVAFSSAGIPADETYVVRRDQLATVDEHFYADPASYSTDSTVGANPSDPTVVKSGFLYGSNFPQAMPADVTDYMGTADGGQWYQDAFTPTYDTILYDDLHTFEAGRTYGEDWYHAPLVGGSGRHTASYFSAGGYCWVCTAGTSLEFAIPMVGDSEPDHQGFYTSEQPPALHFTLYRDGAVLSDGDNATAAEVDGIATTPATYRGVATVDMSGQYGFSQSTHTVTDLTVNSAHSVPLPSAVQCYGEAAGAPCELLPALSLSYDLATDLTNTSAARVQLLHLNVGHATYDGVGSHAPITSVTVSVSFDGGATWRPATVFGAGERYVAAWPNPASAKGTDPELKVSATDAIGGGITQTVVNAYTIAK